MLLKIILQMKVDPDLQQAFLADPEGALAQRGLSEEDRAILLCGDQERIAEAIEREVADPGDVDLGAFSDEVKQVLQSGDKKRIARKLVESQAFMMPTPGPWIYNDSRGTRERRITGIDPSEGKRGTVARIVCKGAYFEDTYAGAELRHAQSGDRISALVIMVTKPNLPQSEGVLKFRLEENARTGAYKLFLRRTPTESFKEAISITFTVK
jgi:hypothetical protein